MVHYVTNERIDVFTKRMELMGIADPAFWTRFVSTRLCFFLVSPS